MEASIVLKEEQQPTDDVDLLLPDQIRKGTPPLTSIASISLSILGSPLWLKNDKVTYGSATLFIIVELSYLFELLLLFH
jgi:hypothetical protein